MSQEKITSFGEMIKQLRIERKLPQRKIAAYLDIDTSLLAKYERNVRQPSRELILKIADLFNVKPETLISEALTDKIAHQILKENVDSKILQIAGNKVEFLKKNTEIIKK